MRRPEGNSTRKQACPSQVARRAGVSRVGRKEGGWTGTVGGVVSGLLARPDRRRLRTVISMPNIEMVRRRSSYT